MCEGTTHPVWRLLNRGEIYDWYFEISGKMLVIHFGHVFFCFKLENIHSRWEFFTGRDAGAISTCKENYFCKWMFVIKNKQKNMSELYDKHLSWISKISIINFSIESKLHSSMFIWKMYNLFYLDAYFWLIGLWTLNSAFRVTFSLFVLFMNWFLSELNFQLLNSEK